MRHIVLIIKGRRSEVSAEHEGRCNREVSSLVKTISKISGAAERMYGLVVGVSGQKITQEFPSA